MAKNYGSEAIKALKGREHVRARPAMYIGATDKAGLHHLVWEILDNSIDEVIEGHADKISLVLAADHRGITITDNGRGIPTEKHPETGQPAVVMVYADLFTGGKFDDESYVH